MSNSLTLFERGAAMLAEANTIQKAKELRDLSLTAADWAKRKGMGEAAIEYCRGYALEAERRLGELLKATERAKAGRPRKIGTSTVPISDAETLDELGVTKNESSEAQLLAETPQEEFEKLKAGKITKAQLKRAKRKRECGKRQTAAVPKDQVGFVTDLSSLNGQKFGCIYADPPWQYSNQSTRGSTDNHYPTLTIEEICGLPIKDLAADNCHLHLWTTNAFLFDCPRIFDAWGFQFRSSFVWVKPQIGMGNYWRNSHEFLLLGVRGYLTAQDLTLRSWLESKRGKHSAKPDRVRNLVERLSPEPRLELFGRHPVEGWTVFGNEITAML